MKRCVIIIPVYKPALTNTEYLSFKRTISILNNYDIVLVTHENLDLAVYEQIFHEYGIDYGTEFFPEENFKGIKGYNRLLLSSDFYKRFSDYEYMLICQLDVYVFRDEVEYWCGKGYDFMGAPLIGKYEDDFFSEVYRVGNGGFSLRKIKAYEDFFNSRKNVFTYDRIPGIIHLSEKIHTRVFVFLLMLLGWRNKPVSVAKRWQYNEDDFWSGLLDNSRFAMKKPTPQESFLFAFERFPSTLFEKTNGKLPFGCHAWEKYEYETFWKKYIK